MMLFRVRSAFKNEILNLDDRWKVESYKPLCCASCGDFIARAEQVRPLRINEEGETPSGEIIPIAWCHIKLVHERLFRMWERFFSGFGVGSVDGDNPLFKLYVPVWSFASSRLKLYSDHVLDTSRCKVCGRIRINARWEESTWIPRDSVGEAHVYTGFAGSDFYVTRDVITSMPPSLVDRLAVKQIEVRDTPAPYGSVYSR